MSRWLDFGSRPSWIWDLAPASFAMALTLGPLAHARAQVVATVSSEDDACVEETLPSCENAGDRCASDSGWCVPATTAGGEDEPYCLPDRRLLCCEADNDCPASNLGRTSCREVSGVTGTTRLCLESEDYCSATPTLAHVRKCHRSPHGGDDLVVWEAGDCDGDGLPNGEDPDPCQAPAPRAYWTGDDGCVALSTGCPEGAECRSTAEASGGHCVESEDGHGTRCVPDEEVLYCGAPDSTCPDGTLDVVDPESSRSFCVDAECGVDDDEDASIDLLDCITGSSGERTVYSLGDCDRDGLPNGRDEDPCEPSDETRDAGSVAERDAGPAPTIDAQSPTVDGGNTTGPPVDPRFQGGGGCHCRATPAGSDPPLEMALVLLGLAATRRRRG